MAARGESVPYLGGLLRTVPQPGRTRVHRRGAELLSSRPAPSAHRRSSGGTGGRRARRSPCDSIAPARQRERSYSALTIRAQRTRWASCSRNGAMSFNWRLLLAPEPVLDYVVWHEVCHLEVMDHSPRFWALLGRRCPDYREQARWLRRHGATLVL